MASAASHSRVVALAAALSGCGDGTPVVDSAVVRDDARVDAYAGPRETPSIVASSKKAGANVSGLTLSITVPAGLSSPRLYLSVHVGSSCSDTSVPQIESVTLGQAELARYASRVGTPCQQAATRSELWELDAPPDGAGTITITASAQALTLHSIAVVVDKVDGERPYVAASGEGTMGMLVVPSGAGELVVAALGAGNTINATPMPAVLQNVTTNFTLDNSAIYAPVSTGTSTTISFTQAATDQWQIVAVSVHGTPAP